jgi:hypothetical protein
VTKRSLKMQPTWSDVNKQVASFDWTASCSCYTIPHGDR